MNFRPLGERVLVKRTEVENKTAFLLTIDCPVCNTVVTKTLNKKVDEQLSVPEKYNHLPF